MTDNWSTLFNRCGAKVPRNDTGYWGRCDLKRGHEGLHLLERDMEWLWWSTEFVVGRWGR